MSHPNPRSVLDLIAIHASTRPNQPAIHFRNRTITYRSLDDAATRISWLLHRRGIRHGDRVAVLGRRCPELVACFLGVLKAGAAYVPVDVESWSEERVRWVVEKVKTEVVLDASGAELDLEWFDGVVVPNEEIENAFSDKGIDVVLRRKMDREIGRPWEALRPDDLAYIIFTSGTTSAPKGVMLPHRGVLHYVQQGGEEAPFNMDPKPEDKVLLIFSPAFDACTGVVFSSLCNGAQLCIADTSDFLHWMSICTIIPCTPSVLAAVQEPHTCSQVRRILVGGEAPSPSLVRKWSTITPEIFNAYGPTETTFASLIARLHPDKPVILGRPMAQSRCILLDDDDGGGPLRESEYGEICITGPGLALGYYENPGLSAQKFISWEGEMTYRTGDFARRTEHGLEFAGRKDSFVKNRGFLVNIDSQVVPALTGWANIETATAFMHKGRLVGFVTPETIDTSAMRQGLAERHDAFVVPDVIRAVDALPLTPNGKADNRALGKLLDDEIADEQLLVEIGSEGGSKTDVLRAAISSALSMPLADITEDKSFWELGGNSLAALKVVSFLRRRKLNMGLKSLLSLPNLAAVCETVTELPSDQGNSTSLAVSQAPTSGPMTTLQAKMVQGSLKKPGVNYMLLRISIPHTGQALDEVAFRTAWHDVLQRHSIFRTSFHVKENTQDVASGITFNWTTEYVTEVDEDRLIGRRSEEIRDLISHHDQDETFAPQSAYRLITVPNQRSTLLMLAHHAQTDGWSLAVVLEEVRQLLDGKSLGDTAPAQFMSAALVQDEHQSNVSAKDFWTSILADHLGSPQLSLPRPEPNDSPSDWTQSLKLGLDLTAADLESGARRLGVSPATLAYTAWGLVLSNYTFTDNVTFGAVFSGRNLAVEGIERMVGPLLNTCPFPVQFKQQQSVSDLLSETYTRLLQILEYQWSANAAMSSMAADSIAGALQTIVVMEYDLPSMEGTCESFPKPWTFDREDLMEFGISVLLESESEGEGLRARILFDWARYSSAAVERMLLHFKNTLAALLAPECRSVDQVRARMISGSERASLLQSCEEVARPYTGFATVKDAFEDAAARWPDMLAVESVKGSMTYRDLDQAANNLANHLRSITRPKDVIGILTDGSLYWIVAIIATLKAGCICCPIDVNLPKTRVDTIIAQSGASIFAAANSHCAKIVEESTKGHQVLLADEFQNSRRWQASRLETITQPKDTIYLVFTSGSTGVPKGVPLHNLSLLHVIDNAHVRLFAKPGRRISQLFALGFDVVSVEIFGSLCYGATLVLKDPNDPFAHMKGVNATMATPSLLSACSPEDYANLDTIALAGEPVPQALADAWAHRVHLMNLYGPSECGPISTGTHIRPGESATIGKPIHRLNAYLLDHQQCLVPVGVTGEIYISGEQMTHGYWNVPEKTKQVFLPNPFVPGTKMYRTGDLGFWSEDMKIHYVGRIDNQVKVRGFRIELEEVERALAVADPGVQVAAVAVVDRIRIVAFVTPEGLDTGSMRRKLTTLLPAYARPAQIISVASLPTSANFKVDRKALAVLASTYKGQGDLPATATEKMIAATWKGLLTLEEDRQIQRDDDFLGIGGNSLLAIKAARLISTAIGHHVPVPLLIRETVLSSLAEAIDRHAVKEKRDDGFSSFAEFVRGASSTVPRQPLSYLEEEMAMVHSVTDTRSVFNTAFHFVIDGEVRVDLLREAFTSLIAQTPMLRSRYTIGEGGKMIRQSSDDITMPLMFAGADLNMEKLQILVDTPFDLAADQLFRVVIWKQDEGLTSVTMITHHIITDKASLAMMLQAVSDKYQAALGGAEAPVSKQAAVHSTGKTYADWASWLQDQEGSPIPQATRHKQDFWKTHLWQMQPLPLSKAHHTTGQALGSSQSLIIPSLPNKQPFSQRLVTAASALTLRAMLNHADVTLCIPYMNRDEPGTASLLGIFVDRLPVRLSLTDRDAHMADAKSLLDHVATEINTVVEQQLPFWQIQATTQTDEERAALADVMVLYHWQSDAVEHSLVLPGAGQARSVPMRARGAKFPLQLEFTETNEGLRFDLEYNTRIVGPGQVATILEVLPRVLEGLASGRAPVDILGRVGGNGAILQDEGYRRRISNVKEAMSEILGLDVDAIGNGQSFFALGGSSVLVPRLHWLLERRGLHGSVADILRASSPAQIAWIFYYENEVAVASF